MLGMDLQEAGFSLKILVAGERCNATGELNILKDAPRQIKTNHRPPNIRWRILHSKCRIL